LAIKKDIRTQLNFTDDELLYDKNSINILHENIELLEELRKQIKKHNPKDVERRNGMLIFDLVTKYCQNCETLGAMINAFEESNRHKSPSSTIVLKYLKDYKVYQVTNFFKQISSPNYRDLSDEHKEKLIYAFGCQKLDKNKKNEIVHYIFDLLKEIVGVYIFFVRSYNAYKHGHRVWYGYDLLTEKGNSLVYIEKQNTPHNYKMDYVPLDDNISTDYIIPHSKDCQTLFDLILRNNKSMSTS